jgi:hypothetical protein
MSWILILKIYGVIALVAFLFHLVVFMYPAYRYNREVRKRNLPPTSIYCFVSPVPVLYGILWPVSWIWMISDYRFLQARRKEARQHFGIRV